MKKFLGIILIIIGCCLALILKLGPAKETKFLFEFGVWPLIIAALAVTGIGLVLYNKNK
ncbi:MULTISPECIES: hypothetical protein [unclassified Flavobacterium]|uniref:hypothetical protein n=1 Tax=unclassified Flavobacterium TaxID=196869 RepID=UPI0013D8DC38|nr:MULTISPECIES: hypothetical protein [unclassified Flavobacterium]MBA5792470.1 hypothetical protein [Flavobacterium sp. xlx-221]